MSSHVKLKPFVKSHKALHAELILVDALLYRSKNQYRGFPFWRKVQEVKRAASRVERDIGSLIAGFSLKKAEDAQAKQALRRKSSRQLMQAIETVHSAANRAYLSLRQIIALESFMPLVLSLTAIVAKISSIAEELIAHVALSAAVLDQLTAMKSLTPSGSLGGSALSQTGSVTTGVVRSSPKSTMQSTVTGQPVQAVPRPEAEPQASPSAILLAPTASVSVSQLSQVLEAPKRKSEDLAVKQKKKKRKKDEIDAIFGGL